MYTCACVWIDPVELVRMCVCMYAHIQGTSSRQSFDHCTQTKHKNKTQYHHCTRGGTIPLSSDQLQHCRAQSPYSDPQSKHLRPENETAGAVHFTIVPQTCVLYLYYHVFCSLRIHFLKLMIHPEM